MPFILDLQPLHIAPMAASFNGDEKPGDIETASPQSAVQEDPPLEPLARHRSGSINFTTGPARVNARAKIVGEFRTLR